MIDLFEKNIGYTYIYRCDGRQNIDLTFEPVPRAGKRFLLRRQVRSILLVAIPLCGRHTGIAQVQTLVVPTQTIEEELKRSLKNTDNTGKQSCFYLVTLWEICHCLLLVRHKT
ncbi:MAG: hypothetical protein KME60_10575 [Cyanomargarita calcarea GSE-NOS-MK-12-04C]|uniref:Uncharacterized protein n=1 Tax=Cyanomargarita calcarea GSE-NOS-MK-12-04C TaxID=2839659 RepID=A0A951QMW9_9CYAN|nr:hypothetical protein [Cyanomargarita calcarea GSE-NOS-MK-12-04C]